MLCCRQDDYMTFERERNGGFRASDHSIILRKRKRDICHRIHNSTWLIETFSITLIIVLQLILINEADSYMSQSISFTISLVTSKIFVPFSLLFNETRIKILILERGWVCAIKYALRYNIFATVAPQQNFNLQNSENSKKVFGSTARKRDVIQISQMIKHVDNEETIRNPSHKISSKQIDKTLPQKCTFSREGENDIPGQVIIS